MTSIPIGVQTVLTQNVVYGMPAASVEITTTAALQSSLTEGGTFTAFTSAIVTGCFVKCTTGSATVMLRKNTVG
jgi:hypothetical protein